MLYRFVFLLFSAWLLGDPVSARPVSGFSWQVQCIQRPEGCPCFDRPNGRPVLRLYHMQAAWPVPEKQSLAGWKPVRVKQKKCYYPAKGLRTYKFFRGKPSRKSSLDHSPLPFLELFSKKLRSKGIRAHSLLSSFGRARVAGYQKHFLGLYWPTYYHLAWEGFHPGPIVDILDPKGRRLGRASKAFLRQAMWEGSGISKSGLHLHYSGRPFRFSKYSSRIWAWGAGYGYTVFPYRTIAVNFPALCRAMGIRPCGKKTVIGSLLWIREVAENKIRMDDGKAHDGFFCATDTGSPNYIRRDRIDIFVGLHGGGNPYLPRPRRENPLLKGGIQNLVPSDWRLWSSPKQRVWCPLKGPSYDPKRGATRGCKHDYHTTARHKALRIFYFPDSAGRPLKCRPGLWGGRSFLKQ